MTYVPADDGIPRRYTGPAVPPAVAYVEASETAAQAVFRHTQSTPSDIWTIKHGLGYYVLPTIRLNDGATVEAALNHPDLDTLIITFSEPVAGEAHLR